MPENLPIVEQERDNDKMTEQYLSAKHTKYLVSWRFHEYIPPYFDLHLLTKFGSLDAAQT